MKTQNIKSKLADLKKKADYRKSALPSVKDAQDAKIENKMANELEPYVYKLITEDNQWN